MSILTEYDFELLAGGSDTTGDVDPVIIEGNGGSDGGDYSFDGNGDASSGGSGSPSGPAPAPTPDGGAVEVIVRISRPLTAAEQKAVNDLRATVAQATTVINNLRDDDVITLSNGDQVTGRELKEIWANTDFTINEVNTPYPNGTTRGQADYNGGNPEVSVNIDVVVGYNLLDGGLEHMVLHELGHMTGAGRESNAEMYQDGVVTEAERVANERVANDIARAIANAGGLTVMDGPASGYSTGGPLIFSSSPTGEGSAGDGHGTDGSTRTGGGSGGGGGGGSGETGGGYGSGVIGDWPSGGNDPWPGDQPWPGIGDWLL